MTAEGKPSEADCAEILADIYVYLDHECDGDRQAIVQQHLDDCSSCLERYGIERQLKELLHRKCGGEHAPTDLRERLKASIRERTTSISGPEGTTTVSETRVEIETER